MNEDYAVSLVERGLRFARLAVYGATGVLLGYGPDAVLDEPHRALLAAVFVGLLYALEGGGKRPAPPAPGGP